MRTPDPYGFTAATAVAIALRALAGDFSVGYQTPSSAYGADLLRQFDDIEWEFLGDTSMAGRRVSAARTQRGFATAC